VPCCYRRTIMLYRDATLWSSPYRYHCREPQPTERFYKSVRPCSRVFRYKTLYLRWLWL